MNYIIFGLVTGSILLLGTVGFAMVRRAEGFLNIAHGQMALIGAYLAYFLSEIGRFPLSLAFACSVLLTAGLGALLARIVFRPLLSQGPVALLFSSIGLAYVLYGLMTALVGPAPRSYPRVDLGFVDLGGFRVSGLEILIIVGSLAVAGLLHLFLTRTISGKAIRAVAGNPDLAKVRGIDRDRVSTHVWLIASGLAALAGILVGLQGVLTLQLGWNQILIILAAAILGGTGSIYGVMIGSMLLGLAMDLSVLALPSQYRIAVAFALVILVLLIRPKGIAGEET